MMVTHEKEWEGAALLRSTHPFLGVYEYGGVS